MSTPEKAGPPAPGETKPGPFGEAKYAIPNVQGSHAPAAWQLLMHALGRELQGGMRRAELARRRLQRMR